jgi:hypothetical protein
MKTYTENSLYTFERKFLQQKKYAPEIIDLVETIKEGVSAIESAVVSNVCSKHLYGSKGLSIYFPPRFLDESYNDCQFHKKSSWPKFLKKFSALICH